MNLNHILVYATTHQWPGHVRFLEKVEISSILVSESVNLESGDSLNGYSPFFF